MSSPSHPYYTKTPRCLITIFDLTHPGAEERLRREQIAWRSSAHIERLTADSAALIIHPGGAREIAA
jgi:hypothetical protein